MAFFLDSLGLSELSKNQNDIIELFNNVNKISGEDYDYKTYTYDEGLELVARINRDSKDYDFVGVDSHFINSNKYICKPVISLGQTAEIPAVLFSSLDEKTAFLVNLVHAGLVKGEMNENSIVSLQLCAYPSSLEVYENRESYESAVNDAVLRDKSVLPYYYIKSLEKDLTEEEKNRFLDNILFNLIAAKVIETKEYKFGENPCFISTLDTDLGNLDIIYSKNIISNPLTKDAYVVGAFYLSAEFSLTN
ncbi:MAG: hypothetical protein ACPKM0_08390 [Pleomorphochaeta sp.]